MATEKRLIDANAFRDYWNKNYRHQYANDTFLFALANFPTVDAVEVVRCKDCRYFYRDDEFNRAWCGYDKCVANEIAVNGYCYRGERKDNESKM